MEAWVGAHQHPSVTYCVPMATAPDPRLLSSCRSPGEWQWQKEGPNPTALLRARTFRYQTSRKSALSQKATVTQLKSVFGVVLGSRHTAPKTLGLPGGTRMMRCLVGAPWVASGGGWSEGWHSQPLCLTSLHRGDR